MAKSKGKRRNPKRKGRSRERNSRSTTKLPKQAVTLIVILRANEGQELLLEAELRALVAPTRKEEGCLAYDLYRAADNPGAYLLHEIWASRDHHKQHTQTPHFLRWDARKNALLASREANFWTQLA